MKIVELNPLDPILDQLLELAKKEAGLTLTKAGQAVAQLIPVPDPAEKRVAPLHPGAMEVSDDFDSPLPDDFWLGKS